DGPRSSGKSPFKAAGVSDCHHAGVLGIARRERFAVHPDQGLTPPIRSKDRLGDPASFSAYAHGPTIGRSTDGDRSAVAGVHSTVCAVEPLTVRSPSREVISVPSGWRRTGP